MWQPRRPGDRQSRSWPSRLLFVTQLLRPWQQGGLEWKKYIWYIYDNKIELKCRIVMCPLVVWSVNPLFLCSFVKWRNIFSDLVRQPRKTSVPLQEKETWRPPQVRWYPTKKQHKIKSTKETVLQVKIDIWWICFFPFPIYLLAYSSLAFNCYQQ